MNEEGASCHPGIPVKEVEGKTIDHAEILRLDDHDCFKITLSDGTTITVTQRRNPNAGDWHSWTEVRVNEKEILNA